MTILVSPPIASPLGKWHEGERQVQALAGVAEQAAQLQEYVRYSIPDQHREFYSNQPLLYVGTRDLDGFVWGSVVAGRPGFLSSPSNKELTIDVRDLHPADPSALHVGSHVGALGLELHSRRRNRVNGTVTAAAGGRVTIKADLTTGNCPKYIQGRTLDIDFERLGDFTRPGVRVERGVGRLPAHVAALVRAADTVFIASVYEHTPGAGTTPAAVGADMSHRGGPPGFVQVDCSADDGTLLTWPEYKGNNFFMTLGNLAADSRCGLLVVDYATGGTLHLSGHACVNYEDRSLPGAERSVRFTVERFVHIACNLPLGTVGGVNYSPYLPYRPAEPTSATATASTNTAVSRAAAPKQAPASSTAAVQQLEIASVTDEAPGIKTYSLRLPRTPDANSGTLSSAPASEWASADSQDSPVSFKAGQYAVFDFTEVAESLGLGGNVTRTWTISSDSISSRSSRSVNITVKRVGRVTGWMHDKLRAGMRLSLRAVDGEFTVEAVAAAAEQQAQAPAAAQNSAKQGVLLLAGGIGITPFRSMLPELARAATPSRPLTLVYSVRTKADAAFWQELCSIAAARPLGAVHMVLALTARSAHADATMEQPDSKHDVNNVTVVHGRVDAEMLERLCGGRLSRHVTAVCGPEGFMVSCEQAVTALGLPSHALLHESFDF